MLALTVPLMVWLMAEVMKSVLLVPVSLLSALVPMVAVGAVLSSA